MRYRELKAPISAQLEITENCNNNCVHCYNHWREDDDKNLLKSLGEKESVFIAEKIVENKFFSVTLTGGEPLIFWRRLAPIISILSAGGVKVSLNSNLILLTPQIAEKLKSAGLKSVLVSVLSRQEEVHDNIVNQKGSWQKTIGGIKTAIVAGLRVSANMVLLQQNYNDIYETAKFLQQLGVVSFSATKASPALNARNFDKMRISKQQLKESLVILEKIKDELKINVDVLECYPLCLIGDIDRFSHFARRSCTAGVTTCTISPGGNVRPCSHADMSYGNILEENFSQIWQRMSDWRLGKYIPKECEKCRFLKKCSGGCRMEAKYCGDICGKDPYMSGENDVITSEKRDALNQIPTLVSDCKYTLRSDFRWREEKFGAVASTSASGSFLVNKDGANILKILQVRGVFTIKELEKEVGAEKNEILNFVFWLLKKRIIYPVTETEKRR